MIRQIHVCRIVSLTLWVVVQDNARSTICHTYSIPPPHPKKNPIDFCFNTISIFPESLPDSEFNTAFCLGWPQELQPLLTYI